MDAVSLYIPCFNASATIEACVVSALKQDHRVKEIVVIDDGSTDRTAQIVSRFPVRLIRHERNRGLAAARNTALKAVDAALVASVDADCVLAEDWLGRLVERLSCAGVAGAGGKLLELHSSTPPDRWRAAHMKQHWGDDVSEPPFLFGSNAVFRKEALEKAGFYEEDLGNNYEDVSMCFRLARAGYKLAYDPGAVVRHLRRDDACSVLDTHWQWHAAYNREKKFYSGAKDFCAKLGENIGTANRYLEEDLAAGRRDLLYLDYVFAVHHTLRDMCYYFSQNPGGPAGDADAAALPAWLAFADVVFFRCLDRGKAALRTFLPPSFAGRQNGLVLLLLVSRLLEDILPSEKLRTLLLRDLLQPLCGRDDGVLAEKILCAGRAHAAWQGVLSKGHPLLDKASLEVFFAPFRQWTGRLIFHFPDFTHMMAASAEATQQALISRGGFS
ncbi:MAG: glycosyltransferase family 2 protein [Candidatus Omnitrophica bacterium]|nr:glycosyltransferase family 2 protein [Candidatus Omnitrophota bacterium]